jgi:D-glycero-alpha-D-manno-heptose-7-phosphate kinase
MIITRSPLRITLGGGGTDLPSYYHEHGGFLIAAAIDRYVYIALNEPFNREFLIKYSQYERVDAADQIAHPIVRESLKLLGVEEPVEIASMADIPAGTGMGSSGSFTTALLRALHAYRRDSINARELAEQACHVELDILREPIGKQDQYIAAFGGLTAFEFNEDDTVGVSALRVPSGTLYELEDRLILLYTGVQRSASAILRDQDTRTRGQDSSITENLHYVKELGRRSARALESGDSFKFGELMNEQWEYKKQRAKGMSSTNIDNWYDLARNNGAIGGKLIGAGGGGFLMFLCDDKRRVREVLSAEGLREVRLRFDFEGCKVVAS